MHVLRIEIRFELLYIFISFFFLKHGESCHNLEGNIKYVIFTVLISFILLLLIPSHVGKIGGDSALSERG